MGNNQPPFLCPVEVPVCRDNNRFESKLLTFRLVVHCLLILFVVMLKLIYSYPLGFSRQEMCFHVTTLVFHGRVSSVLEGTKY